MLMFNAVDVVQALWVVRKTRSAPIFSAAAKGQYLVASEIVLFDIMK